jgi:hypothetical protein
VSTSSRITTRPFHTTIAVAFLAICAGCGSGGDDAPSIASVQPNSLTATEQACINAGWTRSVFRVNNLDRKVMWKAPAGTWANGAIVILHGGGGKADDFCTGGALIQPQIAFANLALQNGFAVFALESTNNVVTDSVGRSCGKRFDFSVLNRPNVDLPYIENVLTTLIPLNRPIGSNQNIFMTGLSTGGYMTTRASSRFDSLITAFAPISAGDPYGTDTVCDPALSPRDSAIGILVDRETNAEIGQDSACFAASYPNESLWESQSPPIKPTFKQFQHQQDGVIDYSCAQKANVTLQGNGYTDAGAFVLSAAGGKNVLLHLWLNAYNQPIIDFFLGF